MSVSYLKFLYFFLWRGLRYCIYLLSRNCHDWVFVGDGSGWSIDHDGREVLRVMENSGISVDMTPYSYFINCRALHFGSLHSYRPRSDWHFIRAEKIVVTCFHGNFGVSDEMDKSIKRLLSHSGEIDILIVSNKTMFERFQSWGFPISRLRIIPVGVDINKFSPVNHIKRYKSRLALGLSMNTRVIGSFQKDGIGWGEGMEPKYIKGPDVFCDVIEKIAAEMPIHVLLTGPARGYVKKRLENLAIPFTYHLLDSPDELPKYYHAVDCYLMCSREEGGPKAVVEAMSCGIPLIATRVGLARDIEEKFKYGWFADTNDVAAIAEYCRRILIDNDEIAKYTLEAPALAKIYSWKNIGKAHFAIYQELLK